MNIVYNSKDNDKCTTNSNYGYKHNNYTGRRKKSNFNINPNLKHSFVLFFTLSIITTLPFNILSQIQIQTTEAFDPSVINDNISGMRDKTNGNSNDNDDSIDSKDINKIVIVRDDKPGTELSPTETTESQIDIQSRNKVYRGHVNSNANDNANEIVIVTEDQAITKSSSITSTASQVTAQSSHEVYGDFNGDGRDDLAVGVPGEDVDTGAGTIINAGAVNVLYGSSNGLSATSPRPDQIWTQSTTDVNDLAETDDFFGSSLSSGDFNGDGGDDLAVGVGAEDVDTGAGTIINAGAVNVLYGSSNGLSATSPRPDQIWTQSTTDVNDLAETGDVFGGSLSSGDFNGDGRDDLAVGVPTEDVDTGAGTITFAGAVNVLYGSSNGLSATSPRPDQFWTQNSPDVNDLVEINDFFGSSLSAGDFNGDGRDDLAIGVPLENVDTGAGTIGNAGAVNVLYGSSNGLSATSPRPDQFWTQSTTDVNDLAEASDVFGDTLLTGDFNGDGRDDLAIGVPNEGVDTGAGTLFGAGAVNVLYGSSSGLSATTPRPDQFWTQSSPDVNDLAEANDRFSGLGVPD